jgi:hypothetical protein
MLFDGDRLLSRAAACWREGPISLGAACTVMDEIVQSRVRQSLPSGTMSKPPCSLGTIFSVICFRVFIDRCTLRTQLLSLVRRKESQRAISEDKSIELLA